MEPLKNFYSIENAMRLAEALHRAWPRFPKAKFLLGLENELEPLELKERMNLLSIRVAQFLPAEYSTKVDIILGALAHNENDRVGLRGFILWPLSTLISQEGLDDFDLSMKALKEITKLFTAEFDVRPFLEREPDRCLRLFQKWTQDQNHHVRRLVSEGTRPRLPWGSRLMEWQNNPELSRPLLEALRKDESLYVRKSVANHLNDHSKAHPEWTLELLEKWAKQDPHHDGVLWIIRHALRSLIKAGDSRALRLLGVRPQKHLRSQLLSLSPKRLRFGQSLEFEIEVHNRSKVPCEVLLDYVIHYQKADGRLSPKVFKGRRRTLAPGEKWVYQGKHAFRPQTTRTYFAGLHELSWQVNGQASKKFPFQLVSVPRQP